MDFHIKFFNGYYHVYRRGSLKALFRSLMGCLEYVEVTKYMEAFVK